MGRSPCCDKNGLKKGPWTAEEDKKLIDYIQKNGYGNWRKLPTNAGLQRCGKSCRLRWTNYLRPDIKRGRFSFEEEETIIQLHSILGNKWSAMAARLPGRTDNEIKNYWNTHIRKRLVRMGIDPVTHCPRLDHLDLSSLYMNPANSHLLKLAASLIMSSQSNFHLGNDQNQFYNDPAPQFQQPDTSQIQNLIQQDQLNVEYSNNQLSEWTRNLIEDDVANYNYNMPCYTSEYMNYQPVLDFPNNDVSNQNYTSVLSTPASSSQTPLNSNSYINSTTEDEKESYCSSSNVFDYLDILDASQFL